MLIPLIYLISGWQPALFTSDVPARRREREMRERERKQGAGSETEVEGEKITGGWEEGLGGRLALTVVGRPGAVMRPAVDGHLS